MRKIFAREILAYAQKRPCFFLTGDLGFMALEEVRDGLGKRFLNCGVAEQNMVGVAAGLAREGFQVFVYSIAPFCYARPFEQIRNDVCMSRLSVCLVGNGGGYAYGHMGPTHHALEDCAAMSALGLRVMVPAFDTDMTALLATLDGPTYLRLGYDARPENEIPPPYAPWRRLLSGSRGILVALGPLGGLAWEALRDYPPAERPEVWVVTEMPLKDIPETIGESLNSGGVLGVVEEHVVQGGLGMQLAYRLAMNGIRVKKIVHHAAVGYPSGRYGSQAFHRHESGLDADGIRDMVSREMLLREMRG
ncbi:MAG: hypothetical protein LBT15_03540 [Synergistaceae bacterium]|jgi:transketolase|nr:hypothetical protein [Synergistaceae bacterium]